jgi:hypothetical protein
MMGGYDEGGREYGEMEYKRNRDDRCALKAFWFADIISHGWLHFNGT